MLSKAEKKSSVTDWFRQGEPLIWINAAAVAVSVMAVVGLLFLLAIRGFGHFWPAAIIEAQYALPGEQPRTVIGARVETEQVPLEQIRAAGIKLSTEQPIVNRSLYKMGNRDISGVDFSWMIDQLISDIHYPPALLAIERREWGDYYGYLVEVVVDGQHYAADGDTAAQSWQLFQQAIARALALQREIKALEVDEIGSINYSLERLRLRERALSKSATSPATLRAQADIAAERAALKADYEQLQQSLGALYEQRNRDRFSVRSMDGSQREYPVATVIRAYRPNAMSLLDKSAMYMEKLWEFLSDEPREANTEGGVFPAIFGTVMMVLLMSIMVTPFGVIAAVYLREYAKQGVVTRIVRIAVNNLAGVPSIVYGVFGLGFFIYFLGSEIDQLFFSNALPAPTFGTPGLLWASLTLALLTLPVVIVATEEGLSRIPKALREGSLALGATKAETLWRVVLPMASPAMMTGLILAVARAAGEVAPLMLVGVVKLAPSLPLDGNYPYLHLDQKFMHLGFHIFDVGFQSPNIEAARPLVYATAFLLVLIIALLNFSAVMLRNRLRERYKSLEM